MTNPGARRIVGIICIFGVILSLLACQGQEEPEPSRPIRIGLSLDSLVVERWTRDRDYFIQAAQDLGAEVLVENAIEDPFIQIAQIQSLITREVDVLVIVPNHATLLSGVVQEAKAKGIPVISYDRLILDAPVDLYLSFENRQVGRIMAQTLVDHAPQGNYVIINGATSDHNSIMFNEGFFSVLNPAIDRRDIQVVAELWPESWRNEEARDFMNELLEQGVVMDAVIAANDFLAEQAIQALAERRLAGIIPVAGHDADLSACQRIVRGTQLVTVYKPIRKIAQEAAEAAVALASQKPVVPSRFIDNGHDSIPFIALDPVRVTKENMDSTVIADGFHRSEDVYR
ncbi:D-xylose ABC transporter substrate-binding protein [Spirochaeta lutea]|uniref:Periplasmic binding protein domain-containing protein n=1 Tax=Spirochaeta lutea TaxID=1480694 RepID=A0A098QWB0_9SPIO|nr:substrate-binding domain-containing protein [Spirochaeta lutea]KGE71698.1 hypothetical protein DC28_10600 [Spirochaeta lutea]